MTKLKSNQDVIDYLNSIEAANNQAIDSLNNNITNLNEAINDLNDQIINSQNQIGVIHANNLLLDQAIAFVPPDQQKN